MKGNQKKKRKAGYRGGNKPAGRFGIFSTKLPFIDINPRLKMSEKYDEKTLREEYARLRKAAEARLKRIKESGRGKDVLNRNRGGFKTTRSIKTRKELVEALLKVTEFLSSKRSTVSGIREAENKLISALNRKGIEVNESDLADYGGFINNLKRAFNIDDGKYEVSYIADLWNEHKNGTISPEDITEAIKKAKSGSFEKAAAVSSTVGLPF